MLLKTHVPGRNNQHSVELYALSTCMWCRKTKKLLDELEVEYDYIDVDLLIGSEQAEAEALVEHWNPSCSFPTMVIDESQCISGFQERVIREVFKYD